MNDIKIYELIVVGVVLLAIVVVIFIVVFIIAIGMKNRNIQKEAKNEERFNSLTGQINETQKLFKNEIGTVLNGFKKMLDK